VPAKITALAQLLENKPRNAYYSIQYLENLLFRNVNQLEKQYYSPGHLASQ
jgi:hypothetical protein